MKITVATINFNNLEGLKQTVQSVLDQTYTEYEYIVIDGGSTDGSKEYIANNIFRIDYWESKPDRGIYHAMNKAIAIAQGEYCIFMNSGDTFYNKEVLAHVAPYLNGEDFYVGHPIRVKKNGKAEKESLPQNMSIDFLLTGSVNHQSTFTRTAILKENPYNENHKIVSDWEKLFEEWLLHNRSYVPLDIIVSRYHLDGISSSNMELLQKEKQEVIDRLIPKEIQNKFRLTKDLSPLELKIKKAMSKPPIPRDLKLLRNAFKYLIRDSLHQLEIWLKTLGCKKRNGQT